MHDGLPLDPLEILGLSAGATAEQVREAFHRKSKKYHPDLGGDEWAFRIVSWAFEQLGSGFAPPPIVRLFRLSEVEQELAAAAAASESTEEEPSGPVGVVVPPVPPGTQDWTADSERIRPGVHDRHIDASRIVAVEVLWMRYEIEDGRELLRRVPRPDRHISGSLHIRWPDPDSQAPPMLPTEARDVLADLTRLYHWHRSRPGVTSARLQNEPGRFDARLTYPSGSAAWEVFKMLRDGLNAAGLGVRQWTRDLTIPRESSSSY